MLKFKSRDQDHCDMVTAIIYTSILEGRGDWVDITEAVEKKFTVENWMGPRACLQSLINRNQVKRDRSNIFVEVYVSTESVNRQ